MLKCVGVQVDHCLRTYVFLEGSLEVKLVTIWTDEKQRWEEPETPREKKRRKEDQRRESPKKEDLGE